MGTVRRIDRPKPWLARYQGPDGRQYSKSFRRKVDAETWVRREESRMDQADWVNPRGGSTMFSDWAAIWLNGRHELKPKTAEDYRWHLQSRVLPTFGDRTLSNDPRSPLQPEEPHNPGRFTICDFAGDTPQKQRIGTGQVPAPYAPTAGATPTPNASSSGTWTNIILAGVSLT